MRVSFIYAFAALLSLTHACGDSVDPMDPIDGGFIPDGSLSRDAGAMWDAGPSLDGGPSYDAGPPLVINPTPCEFGVESFVANETYDIDCTLDLSGATALIPSGVTLVFDGGEIRNGTLDFETAGSIDGELLHQNLEITGDVTLIDPVFQFRPERWDIQEGPTDTERALANTTNLEALFFFTQSLGATEVRIGRFDCYFEVTQITPPRAIVFYPHQEAVNLPSNFTLRMSDDTHLRILPARGQGNNENGAILSVRDERNVSIIGGHLHGDRDERIYTSEDIGLEGSHLLYVNSGHDVTLDGIDFINGSKGSLSINSIHATFEPEYDPTSNVTVRGCSFTNSRRMAIALTNGRNILIEGNTFTNTANPSENSDGGEVGYAINIEAARTRDEDGVLVEYERAIDIVIRNNREVDSRGGFATLSIGQNIIVEDNDLDGRVVSSLTNGSRIRNNRFTAITPESAGVQAIFAAGEGVTVFDNEISGNTISGYDLGIATRTHALLIYDNVITDGVSGIQLGDSTDIEVRNNTIDVADNGIQCGNGFGGDLLVTGNDITAGSDHIAVTNVNQGEGEDALGDIVFDGNTFRADAKATISAATNIVFSNNTVNGGVQVGDTTNVRVSNNQLEPHESDGVRIFGANDGLSVTNNTISEPTGASRFECINNADDNPDAVTLDGNSCL